MKPKNKFFFFLMLAAGTMAPAQSNTAVASGSIGKCAVWNYPYTLYNTSGASQTVGDGVTVTVDQDRNIGAVNLSGAGALSMSGSNGITLSGSGSEINCRWDVNRNESYTIVNDNTRRSYGPVFTLPYTGAYSWHMGTGWAASVSGAYLGGFITLRPADMSDGVTIYGRNQAGSCGMIMNPEIPETWKSTWAINARPAGTNIYYTAWSGWSNNPSCSSTTLNFTLGNAQIYYEN